MNKTRLGDLPAGTTFMYRRHWYRKLYGKKAEDPELLSVYSEPNNGIDYLHQDTEVRLVEDEGV